MSIGVSFLSFPFVVPPFYQPPPPVSSPSGVSFTTFPATIWHRRLPNRRTQGGRPDAYVDVSYPAVSYGYDGVTYHPVPYAYVDVTYTYVVVTYDYVSKGCH